MSACEISGEKVNTFNLIIKEFLKKEQFKEIDFTGTGLNPYTLGVVLKSLGYELDYSDEEIWQSKIKIPYNHLELQDLTIEVVNLTFEIKLCKS